MNKKFYTPALVALMGIQESFTFPQEMIKKKSAGTVKTITQHDSVFCGKLKDGIIVMTLNDNEIHSQITLSNGIKIFPDGTVIYADGSQIILHDEECIDKDGNPSGPVKK